MADSEKAKPIHIGEFKNKWLSQLTMEDIRGVSGINAKSYVSLNTAIPPAILSELETVCSLDVLDCPSVPDHKEKILSTIPENPTLQSVIYQQGELERRSKHSWYRRLVTERSIYNQRRTPWIHQELRKAADKKAKDLDATDLIDGPEVIITIEIYRPFMKNRRHPIDNEFQVLSSQFLTDLRSKIFCSVDQFTPGEHSNNPTQVAHLTNKSYYKSAYFFIEDTFYNDLRDENNQDNSKVVRDWAEREGVAEYKSCNMEGTRFSDLTVRLGQPYLYEHQGQCQHLMVFSDIRLVHSEDCQYRSQYPIHTLEKKNLKYFCRACGLHYAKWMTRSGPLSPEDPCFYCNTCFHAFHYDVNGQKLFDFKAYNLSL